MIIDVNTLNYSDAVKYVEYLKSMNYPSRHVELIHFIDSLSNTQILIMNFFKFGKYKAISHIIYSFIYEYMDIQYLMNKNEM